jgi:hypothetical protein
LPFLCQVITELNGGVSSLPAALPARGGSSYAFKL